MDKALFGRDLSRRAMLRGGGVALTGAGAGLLFGCGDDNGSNGGEDLGDGPPETTRVRLINDYGSCTIPMSLAREFLVDEGLPDFEYLPVRGPETNKAVAEGLVDFGANYASAIVSDIDAGSNIVVLAGMHGGCIEVFAKDGIENVADLRGKTVAMSKQSLYGSDYSFLTSILRYIGIASDVNFLELQSNQLLTALKQPNVDAVVAIPPLNLQLRDSGNKHVILNSMVDPPWSQQFCCMVIANRDFVKTRPRAAKRTLRAILKAEEACIASPERAAQEMVNSGGAGTYDYALEIVKSISFSAWRTYSPEDALRFAALRLRDAGELRTQPDEIIKRGADWRFLEQIKREMPAAFRPILPRSTGFALDCQVGPLETTEAVAAPRPATES